MLTGMIFSIGNMRFGFMLGSKKHKALKNDIMGAIGHPKYRKPYEAPKVVYIRPRDSLGRYVAYKTPRSTVVAQRELIEHEHLDPIQAEADMTEYYKAQAEIEALLLKKGY